MSRCLVTLPLLVAAWLAVIPAPPFATFARADAGRIIEANLTSGPHPPRDAPDVIVHVPSGYDASKPLDLVVFLHGFDGCARALVAAEPTPCRKGEPPHRVWNLAGLHEAAHTNTLLIVPQLAYLARSASGHRFRKPAAFDAMLYELLTDKLVDVLGRRELADIHSVTLVAHSAGYGAATAILSDSERSMDIGAVVLLDALYAGWHVFAGWMKQDPTHRIISLYSAQAGTTAGNRKLLAALGRLGRADVLRELHGSLAGALRTHTRIVARVPTAHGDMPRAHFAEVLRGLTTVATKP